MSLLHRLSSDREFAFNYSMSSVTGLSKSCVYRLWERQLMGDHGHPVGVFMSCRNFHASKQTILDRNGGSMWKHYSRHEWELLFQPSDCGPCRVHVVRQGYGSSSTVWGLQTSREKPMTGITVAGRTSQSCKAFAMAWLLGKDLQLPWSKLNSDSLVC